MSLSDQQEKGAAEDAIPSFVPPDPLTNVWLIPVVATWEWLAWTSNGGWAVLAGSPVPMRGTWGTNAGLTYHEGRELEVTAKELHLEPRMTPGGCTARGCSRVHGALLAAVTEAT